MRVVEDLLESYSKLRKRRYSLTERLLDEQVPMQGQATAEMGGGNPTGQENMAMADLTPADAQTLLQAVLSPQGITGPLTTQLGKDGQSLSVMNMRGNTVSVDRDTLVGMLKRKIEGGEGEGGEGEVAPGAEAVDPETGLPMEELPPLIVGIPESRADKREKHLEKWASDMHQANPRRTSTADDIQMFNDVVNGRGRSTIIKKFIDAFRDNEDGIWDDPEILQIGVDEMKEGLDVLDTVLEDNDPNSDECINLSKLSKRERKLLQSFKIKGSGNSAAVWWDGDTIFQSRANADLPVGVQKYQGNDIADYGVKMFASHTAHFGLFEGLSRRKECPSPEQKEFFGENFEGGNIIPRGAGTEGDADAGAYALLGVQDENFGPMAPFADKLAAGEKLTEDEAAEWLSGLHGFLSKVQEKQGLKDVVGLIIRSTFAGEIPDLDSPVFQHPFYTVISEWAWEAQKEHPDLDISQLNMNQMCFLYMANRTDNSMEQYQVWGDRGEVQDSSVAGHGVDLATGLDHKRDGDTFVVDTPRQRHLMDNVLTSLKNRFMHLGRDMYDYVQKGMVSVSKKKIRSGVVDLGTLAGETIMDWSKIGGLWGKTFNGLRLQSEAIGDSEHTPLPAGHLPLTVERIGEVEKFSESEKKAEAAEHAELGEALSTNPRDAVASTLRVRRKNGGGFEELDELKGFEKQALALDEMKTDTPAQAKLRHKAVLAFQKDWIAARRRARLKQDPENMKAFLGLEWATCGSSDTDGVIEVDSGSDTWNARQSCYTGSPLYRMMAGDPTMEVTMEGETVTFRDRREGHEELEKELGGPITATYSFRLHPDKKRDRTRGQSNAGLAWFRANGARSTRDMRDDPAVGMDPDVAGRRVARREQAVEHLIALAELLKEDFVGESKQVFQQV